MRTPSDLAGNDVSLFDLISLAAATFITAADEEPSFRQTECKVGGCLLQ